TLAGWSRSSVGRLNADGALDPTFGPEPNGAVRSLALQTDGKIVLVGAFNILGGQSRMGIARVYNIGPATQNLTFDGSMLTWMRGGSSPEVWRTTFEYSPDGNAWTKLDEGTRILGGWQLAGLALPANTAFRARGYTVGGSGNSSGWFVENAIGSAAIESQPVSLTKNAGTTAVFSVY